MLRISFVEVHSGTNAGEFVSRLSENFNLRAVQTPSIGNKNATS